MTMIHAAVYDAEGRLGQVSSAESLGDAVLSLVYWLDHGFVDWTEVPDPSAPRTHRFDIEAGVLVESEPDAPSIEDLRANMRLTPRQLFIGLVSAGFITAEEGVAAATTGAMPAAVEAVVATLDVADQVAARITWAKMTTVLRTDPLVDMLAAAEGKTPEEIDAFFVAYAGV